MGVSIQPFEQKRGAAQAAPLVTTMYSCDIKFLKHGSAFTTCSSSTLSFSCLSLGYHDHTVKADVTVTKIVTLT